MEGEDKLRKNLVDAYLTVDRRGLMRQASGNVSCRFGDGMLISCSGADSDNISSDRVVYVNGDGEFCGDIKPSSEWRMHLSIYKKQESANAVVHTHSDYCVALACHNLPLPGFHYMVGLFGNTHVPCVPYATFGTQELGDNAAAALTDQAACLLGNHGMICRGANFKVAIDHAERLEIICKHYVLSRTLGEPDYLTDEQWDEFFGRAKKVAYSSFI